jgi:hypothetical protein
MQDYVQTSTSRSLRYRKLFSWTSNKWAGIFSLIVAIFLFIFLFQAELTHLGHKFTQEFLQQLGISALFFLYLGYIGLSRYYKTYLPLMSVEIQILEDQIIIHNKKFSQ